METRLTKEELITLTQVLINSRTDSLQVAQVLINLNNKIAKMVQEMETPKMEESPKIQNEHKHTRN